MSVAKLPRNQRPPTKQCDAVSKRTGQRCRARIPIWMVKCRNHGGNSPQAIAAAESRRLAWLAAQRDDPIVSRDPAEALLAAAAEADAMVQRLRAQLADGVFDVASVTALGDWLDRVARISKIVLDARVDERRLRVSEARGNYWAAVIKEILASLALSPEQWARADLVVRESMTRVLERPAIGPGS